MNGTVASKRKPEEICSFMRRPECYNKHGRCVFLTMIQDTKSVPIDAKTSYEVPAHLEFIRKVGSGAYGEKFAVKKIQNAFDDLIDAKRILREIRLLRHFNHENIIRILDMYPPTSVEFEDIYIVTDLMETDLHRVIYSKQQLTDEHAQYFVYQILRGLKYLHSANVIHRDLKPSNILVNKNCDLKICDFGLARGFATTDEEEAGSLTDYVVTRWYRAPEVVLIASEYTRAIDVWSVGCILCELIGRKALFAGKDHLDQIRKIVEIMGTPDSNDLSWLPFDGPARRFINKCPPSVGKPLSELYPKANAEALDIANKMLCFNPYRRVSVEEALSHKYFDGLHSKDDEPVSETQIDWKFDSFKPTKKLLQNYVYVECAKFHPDILERDKQFLAWAGVEKVLRDTSQFSSKSA